MTLTTKNAGALSGAPVLYEDSMKIKITQATVVNSKAVKPGDVVDAPVSDAIYLKNIGKAVDYVEKPQKQAPNPAHKARK